MTRIIGGTARGRRLAVPPRGTRPTSDRAREGLFNSLTRWLDLEAARVLDLYAGSGAVGVEALSRGAAHATFVEPDRRAAEVIRSNVAVLDDGPADRVRVLVRTVEDLTGGAAPRGGPFDLVFADPPYALPAAEVDALVAVVTGTEWLADGGVVVVERARGPGPHWPDAVAALPEKRYGAAVLWYGRRR